MERDFDVENIVGIVCVPEHHFNILLNFRNGHKHTETRWLIVSLAGEWETRRSVSKCTSGETSDLI